MSDWLLTVAEVARTARVPERTVYYWIAQGALEAVRLGERKLRIRASEAERFTGIRPPNPLGGSHEHAST